MIGDILKELGFLSVDDFNRFNSKKELIRYLRQQQISPNDDGTNEQPPVEDGKREPEPKRISENGLPLEMPKYDPCGTEAAQASSSRPESAKGPLAAQYLYAMSSEPGNEKDLSAASREVQKADSDKTRKAHTFRSLNEPLVRNMRAFRNQILRFDAEASSNLASDDQQYVDPTSIQSSESPAAYLVYIYQLALKQIDSTSPFSIQDRLPDLSEFILSDDNLNEKITTISMVNQILATQLISAGFAPDAEALFSKFVDLNFPFSLPFDDKWANVRESLSALSALSLNIVADRGREDSYALNKDDS